MHPICLIVTAAFCLGVTTPLFAAVGHPATGVGTHSPLLQAAKYKGAKGGCKYKFKVRQEGLYRGV